MLTTLERVIVNSGRAGGARPACSRSVERDPVTNLQRLLQDCQRQGILNALRRRKVKSVVLQSEDDRIWRMAAGE